MNVFKKSLFSLLLFVGSYGCFAQEISIRGGLNLSQLNYKSRGEIVHHEGTKLNPGFNIGPIIEIPVFSIFSLETGILLTTKGQKIKVNDNSLFKENLYYMDVPVMLKATIPIRKVKIFGMAGLYAGGALYGYRISEDVINNDLIRKKFDVKWGTRTNEYNGFDYGLKFGSGIKVSKFQVGASYCLGIKNIRNDEFFKRRNRVIEFYLAYQFANLKTSKKHE